MKAVRIKYSARYNVVVAGVPNMLRPGVLLVTDSTTLSGEALALAQRITYAGFLLSKLQDETIGRYHFAPERVDILGAMDIDESVAPR